MPNCFKFTKIGAMEPTRFVDIDEELCRHFGVPVHPTQYFNSWYDIIGLAVACGKKLAEIAEDEDFGEKTREIARYLNERYTTEAWYSLR